MARKTAVAGGVVAAVVVAAGVSAVVVAALVAGWFDDGSSTSGKDDTSELVRSASKGDSPQPPVVQAAPSSSRSRPSVAIDEHTAPPRQATAVHRSAAKDSGSPRQMDPDSLVRRYGAENLKLPAMIGRRLKMPVPDEVYALLDRKVAGADQAELLDHARGLPGPMVLRLTVIEWLEKTGPQSAQKPGGEVPGVSQTVETKEKRRWRPLRGPGKRNNSAPSAAPVRRPR